MTIDKIALDNQKLISRKSFLRLATFGLAIAFAQLWNMMTTKNKKLSEQALISRINISKLGTGIYFFNTFILIKSEHKVNVFSNRCTHAGCRINREIDGQLLCPCHGSRFDSSTGKVLQGPAGLPLNSIPFSMDARSGEIIIKSSI